MDDAFLCGWRIRSALSLPELLPWRGDARAPDVEICIGASADDLHDGVHVSPLLQIDRHGAARLSIEGVASYLVRNGREVTIDPRIDPSLPDVRVFLFGTVLGLLCRQRGLLPFRAACVAIGNKAIALAGAAGRGKSTAAACLALRGHRAVMFRRLLLPRRTTGSRESDAQLFQATAILANRCRVAHLVQEYGFSAAPATSTLLEGLASA